MTNVMQVVCDYSHFPINICDFPPEQECEFDGGEE